jgi:hypothetical protein
MNHEVAFAAFWAREFPELPCPPLPQKLSELNLTAQMAMRSQAPDLYTAMFAGSNNVRLPADVSVRLNSGTLQPGDAGALRAAGFELQAQQCERLGDAQQDQRMIDQVSHSREVYEAEQQRFADYSRKNLLERLANAGDLPHEVVIENRRRYHGE